MAEDKPDACDYEVGASAALTNAGIFPLQACCCLPVPLRAMVPQTCVVIQDFTHLALLAGSLSAGFILMKELHSFLVFQEWNPVKWWKPGLTILATAPNLTYLVGILGQYDQQIVVKEKEIGEQKKALADSYSSLVRSIDDLLGKAAESSATMAERGFESKRRDFQRFLERAEARYAQVKESFSQADQDELVAQFRRFVQRWLAVFAECSVDPIKHPKRVVTDDELARCRSIGEIASLTLERLKCTEVRFITSRCDEDKKLLMGFRAQHRRLTVASATPLQCLQDALQGNSASSHSRPLEIEMSSSVRGSVRHSVQEDDSDDGCAPRGGSRGPRATIVVSKRQSMLRSCCPCGWLSTGSFGLRCTRGGMPGGFPASIQCVCAQLILLSREHLALIVAWTCVVLLVVMEALTAGPQRDGILMVGVFPYFVALVILVVKFEQIDVVQRLEREVEQLKQESESIRVRREQMVSFWNGMQELTDLWVHRTVPRLDLLKEVQQYLEYVEPGMCLSYMGNANSRLEELEKMLPALEVWKNGSPGEGGEPGARLSEASKKAFSARITGLCREESLEKVVIGLQALVQDELPRLVDDDQAHRHPAQQPASGGTSSFAAAGAKLAMGPLGFAR